MSKFINLVKNIKFLIFLFHLQIWCFENDLKNSNEILDYNFAS